MSLTQYCLFINNHVGKAAGRMFNPPPPHCEILRTPMLITVLLGCVKCMKCELLRVVSVVCAL